jgi:hypothetical protein
MLTPPQLSLQVGKALSGKEGAWPMRVGGPPAPSKGHLLVLLTEGWVAPFPTALWCCPMTLRRRRCRPPCWLDVLRGRTVDIGNPMCRQAGMCRMVQPPPRRPLGSSVLCIWLAAWALCHNSTVM